MMINSDTAHINILCTVLLVLMNALPSLPYATMFLHQSGGSLYASG